MTTTTKTATRRAARVLLLALSTLGAVVPAGAAAQGTVTLTLENDLFSGSDNNYTNGLGLTWVSDAVRSGDPGLVGRWTRFWSFLPLVGDEAYTTYASWALAHEMNTPDDITDPNPSPDDQPYAGILAVDSILYVHRRHWTHAWQLRLGVVGPASGAGALQRRVHRIVGADTPRGWHTQLPNEPVVNIGYSVAHRIAGGRAAGSAEWRLVPVASVGLGNYFTGAGVGIYGEFGWNLVDALGVSALRSGLNAASTVGVGRVDGWSASLFAGVGSYAVGRYLPLDGTLLRRSRSVDTRHRVDLVSGGLCLRRHDLTLSLAWTRFPDLFPTQRRGTDFGTLSVSWAM